VVADTAVKARTVAASAIRSLFSIRVLPFALEPAGLPLPAAGTVLGVRRVQFLTQA
jgi:hypothetical protein